MKIPRALAERIEEQARQGYPFEVCGVLLGDDRTVRDVVPVVNREAESPRVRYQIAPEDLIRAYYLIPPATHSTLTSATW